MGKTIMGKHTLSLLLLAISISLILGSAACSNDSDMPNIVMVVGYQNDAGIMRYRVQWTNSDGTLSDGWISPNTSQEGIALLDCQFLGYAWYYNGTTFYCTDDPAKVNDQ
jgi:opacity protein-like surface antigen